MRFNYFTNQVTKAALKAVTTATPNSIIDGVTNVGGAVVHGGSVAGRTASKPFGPVVHAGSVVGNTVLNNTVRRGGNKASDTTEAAPKAEETPKAEAPKGNRKARRTAKKA